MLKRKLQTHYNIIILIIMQILLFWYGISTAENMEAAEENTTPSQENTTPSQENTTPSQENLITTEATSVESLSLADKKTYQDNVQILKEAGMTPLHFRGLIEQGNTPLGIIKLAKEGNMRAILAAIETEFLKSNYNETETGVNSHFAIIKLLRKDSWSEYINFRNLLTGTKNPSPVSLGDAVSQITKKIFIEPRLPGQIGILKTFGYPEIKKLFLKIGITPLQAEYLLTYEYGSGQAGPRKLYELAKMLDKIDPWTRQVILDDITVQIKSVWGTKIIDQDSRLSWDDFKSLGQFQLSQVHLHGNYVDWYKETSPSSTSSKSEYGQWLQDHKHIVYPCAIFTLGLFIGYVIYSKTK